MEAVIIFPHHIWENHPALQKNRLILFLQEDRFFSAFAFHKKKLVLHRASLKSFQKRVEKKGFKTLYVEKDLENVLKTHSINHLHLAELDDIALLQKMEKLAKKYPIALTFYPSPGFLTSLSQFSLLWEKKEHFLFHHFYINQRKRLGLFLDPLGKPQGGKWSFDSQNRKRLPKNISIPPLFSPALTPEVKEAIQYVQKHYPSNPGDIEQFSYPTTHALAKKALAHFLQERLYNFGPYEDSIAAKEGQLFHSCLSPLLNIGLLTPHQVLEETLLFAAENRLPFASLEGFIRQLIGWREFVRGIYHTKGEEQRKKNFFCHHHPMPKAFYTGSTDILPVDITIHKLQKSGYIHHIERLMVLGNFFLLCQISPHAIYQWFMEFSIDSYDWVMVPNVYGMSQYADGGMMTTKPYFSSSHYILKMSDFPKGSWCSIWDALFWRFFTQHASFFSRQPRLAVLSLMAKKKHKEAQKIGDSFLEKLWKK